MSILLLLRPLVYMASVVTHVPDVRLSSVSSLIPVVFLDQITIDCRRRSDRFLFPQRVEVTSRLKGHSNDFQTSSFPLV